MYFKHIYSFVYISFVMQCYNRRPHYFVLNAIFLSFYHEVKITSDESTAPTKKQRVG